MAAEESAPSSRENDSSVLFYYATFAVTALVIGLGAGVASLRPYMIAVGIFVPSGVGLIMFLLGAIELIQHRSHASGEADFSSLSPEAERAFVVHEKTMRANSGQADKIGWGIAALLFVVGAGVSAGLYTPCTRYCARPPSGCKTDAQIADFKANCENRCRSLEAQNDLHMLRNTGEVQAGKNATRKLVKTPVSGSEYVEGLEGCSFAGGAGQICEEVVKRATSLGLWCEEKK